MLRWSFGWDQKIISYAQHTVWTVAREEGKKGFLFLAPRSHTNGANILDGQGFDKIIKKQSKL